MATLYRNFPGRLELIEELYRSVTDDICAAARAPTGEIPVRRSSAGSPSSTPPEPARGHSLAAAERRRWGEPVLNESRSRVIAAAEPLPVAAQRSGGVRDDVSLGQVLDTVVAAERVRDDPAASRPQFRAVDGPLIRRHSAATSSADGWSAHREACG